MRPRVAALAAVLTLVGCSSSTRIVASPIADPPTSLSTDGDNGGGTVRVSGSIVVAADRALAAPLQTLARRFETLYPGTTVIARFGAANGALPDIPGADAFVGTAPTVGDLSGATQAQPVATDAAVLVVPAANRAKITGVDDLTRGKLRIALCFVTTPCGRLAASATQGLKIRPTSRSIDAAAALGLVRDGTADASIVYGSDVARAPAGLTTFATQSDAGVRYAIRTSTSTTNPAVDELWEQFLLGKTARRAFAAAGLVS